MTKIKAHTLLACGLFAVFRGFGMGKCDEKMNNACTLCRFGVIYEILENIELGKIGFMKEEKQKVQTKPENLSKTTVGKCNGPVLALLFGSLRAYYFLRGVRIKRKVLCGGQPASPAIVLCNHGSFIDFIYAGSLLYKSKPHFIVARLYFYHRILGWMLRKVGAFPKSMFALDMESAKNCLRVLNNGEILAMMPEARLSTAGRFEDIQPSTYSFLKKSKVPIYTVKLRGDYFANPKWGNGVRRGAKIEAELDILYTAEQVQEMTLEQLKEGVEQRLYYDEFQWLASRPDVHYHSKKLAEGLENILTVCPCCHEKYTVTTKGHTLTCKNCGELTSLDDRYGFSGDFCFENFGQWYQWQFDRMRQEILENPTYCLSSKVELRLPGDGKHLTRSAGQGVCTLSRDGLCYEGTRDGEQVRIHFGRQQIYRLLFGAGENFEIYNGNEILYFVPECKQSSVDWYMASIILGDEATEQTG